MTRITFLALVLAACAKSGPAGPAGAPGPEGPSGGSTDRATIAALEKRLKKAERKVANIERVLLQAGASLDPEPDPEAVYSVPLHADDPILGPATAKVTMVEAFEFA